MYSSFRCKPIPAAQAEAATAAILLIALPSYQLGRICWSDSNANITEQYGLFWQAELLHVRVWICFWPYCNSIGYVRVPIFKIGFQHWLYLCRRVNMLYFIIASASFALGRPWYRLKSPKENILLRFISCGCVSFYFLSV